jgi:alpha-glucosidase
VAGQTNWDEREIMLPLNFLTTGTTYQATIVTDGINANHHAEDYHVETKPLASTDRLKIKLASGGGFLMKLIKQ